MGTLYFSRPGCRIRPWQALGFDLCIEVRQSLGRKLLPLLLFVLLQGGQLPPKGQHYLWPLLAPMRPGR
jgi:hypothetical protein